MCTCLPLLIVDRLFLCSSSLFVSASLWLYTFVSVRLCMSLVVSVCFCLSLFFCFCLWLALFVLVCLCLVRDFSSGLLWSCRSTQGRGVKKQERRRRSAALGASPQERGRREHLEWQTERRLSFLTQQTAQRARACCQSATGETSLSWRRAAKRQGTRGRRRRGVTSQVCSGKPALATGERHPAIVHARGPRTTGGRGPPTPTTEDRGTPS